ANRPVFAASLRALPAWSSQAIRSPLRAGRSEPGSTLSRWRPRTSAWSCRTALPTSSHSSLPGPFAREIAIASALARAAGALILRYRDGDLRVELKDGDEPVTIADKNSSDLIVRGLRDEFPQDVVISEENADDLRRLRAHRVWYIDPIDGTKDFI